MAGRHATYAPSSAPRVVRCPGSFLFTKDMPDQASREAVEGTVAHAIHEFVLNAALSGSPQVRRMQARDFIGMTAREVLDDDHPEEELKLVEDLVVDESMANYVQESVDWCLDVQGHHYVEQRVNISNYTPIPDQFGTSDEVCITKGDFMYDDGTIVVTDLKFGKGVKVFAEKNEQLALYALGTIDAYQSVYKFTDETDVYIRVSQPRLDHRDTWQTTVGELRAFGAWIKERFTLASKPGAPFAPSDKACKFCKGKPTCPAIFQRAQEMAKGWFSDLDAEITEPKVDDNWPLSAPAVKPLTSQHLASVLRHRKLLVDFLSEVESHAVHLLMHGQPVPGFKMVEGRSYRQWDDEEFAIEFLKQRGVHPYAPSKVLSPAEAEKKLPKDDRKALAGYVIKPKGKPTLADEDDKREPYALTATEMFSVVDEDEGL